MILIRDQLEVREDLEEEGEIEEVEEAEVPGAGMHRGQGEIPLLVIRGIREEMNLVAGREESLRILRGLG